VTLTEYGQSLAQQLPPLSDAEAESAARVLATVDTEAAA
jgi:hypothetical protein